MAGGLGLSAIQLARAYGVEVYLMVDAARKAREPRMPVFLSAEL